MIDASQNTVDYSWVKTHLDIVQYLKDKKDNQKNLVGLLKSLGIKSLIDEDENGKKELEVIDPFTFFCYIHKHGDKNRLDFLIQLAEKLNLTIPTAVKGLPNANAQKVWLFPYEKERVGNEIDLLWQLFEEVINDEVRNETFKSVLGIKNVGPTKITEVLFYVNPIKYFPINKPVKAYLKAKNIDTSFSDYEGYMALLETIKEAENNKPFYELSYENWLLTNKKTPKPSIEVEIRPDAKVWLIAPGKNAHQWKNFLSGNYAAINYSLGDLSPYTRDEITVLLQKESNSKSEPTNHSLACYQFAKELQIGDVIVAKKGKRKYLGWGIIASDYEYHVGQPDFKHRREISWIRNGEWKETEGPIVLKTLTDITQYSDYVNRLAKLMDIPFGLEEKISPLIEEPTNTYDLPSVNYWWLQANPKIWSLDHLEVGEQQFYTTKNTKGNKRRIYKSFEQVKKGDLVLGYESYPSKQVKALFRITKGIHTVDDVERIDFVIEEKYENPIEWSELKSLKTLENCEFFANNQGSLFSLKEEEFNIIQDILDDRNPQMEELKPYSIEDALQDLFISQTEFEGIIKNLQRKKNLILQGPPGVGKTFVAKRIAYTMLGAEDRSKVEMVQFHQSYSYEDFIQGIRPTDEGGFETKKGVFYRFCEKAKMHPKRPYFFIIDEINRGNLSKIFGELMMLIERDKRGVKFEMSLTYSKPDERFYIPENVFIIGTMNTADRSLAMVDYALRRRFAFIPIRPNFEDLFKNHLSNNGLSTELILHIADKMAALNKGIMEVDALGKDFFVGHSYFCLNDHLKNEEELDWYQAIIDFEIRPLLEEYWFDDLERVKKELEELRYKPTAQIHE